jgi:hypothetical protein
LFIYSFMKDCPFPLLWHSGRPALFAMCLFCCCHCLFSLVFFSFFSQGGGQSVQEAVLIWPRAVCGSTVCHLAHLVVCVSQAGRRCHLVEWESSWFLCLTWSGDAMRRLGVRRFYLFSVVFL